MLNIYCYPNYINERKYIIQTLLGEFLGLEYNLEFCDKEKHYTIKLENNKKVKFVDSFFLNFDDDLNYLNAEHIPKVEFINNIFAPENDIPVIYGNEYLDSSSCEITCGLDIFASSFFMLTRWEEYVLNQKDNFNRFSAYSSLAYKNNFINRPVVDEYVEMLWNMLKHSGIKPKRKEYKFQTILTHDIDIVFMLDSFGKLIKKTAADILKRKSFRLAKGRVKKFIQVKKGKEKDPYDTFDYLMEISQKSNLQSHFYFMNSFNKTKFDSGYKFRNKKILNIIKKIKEQGHVLGFHPSFYTYSNPKKWEKEKNSLEKILDINIKEGRQHYLRYQIPDTLRIWEDNNMEYDLGLGYPEIEGFRCGTCREYNLFDFKMRKKMRLKERPLIVMDVTLFNEDVTFENLRNRLFVIIEKIKKYKGNFVFLWHNSNFNEGIWEKYSSIYSEIIFSQLEKDYNGQIISKMRKMYYGYL